MKIAFVCPAIRLGGVDMVTLRLGESFLCYGHQVTFIETAFCGDRSNWFRERGHAVISRPLSPLKTAYSHAMSFVPLLSSYDIIIYNDDSIGRSIAGLLPLTTIIIPILHTDIDGQYITALGSYNDYDKIIAVSKAIHETAISKWGVPKRDIHFIPSGVEVTSEYPQRQIEESHLKVAFLGRLSDWHKGIFKLPEILGRIDAPISVTLSIIGEGPDGNELVTRFEKLGLSERVHFHGALFKDDIAKVLLQHDVLLMPSNFEGLPIALLEAMAAGVIPIASKLPGSTDLVIEERLNGFLVEKDDLDGFAYNIGLLADNYQLRKEMSRNAWKRIMQKFSLAKMGQEYMSVIYNDLAASPRRSRSGMCDIGLLGDLPCIPSAFVRPVRKLLKITGLWNSRAHIIY